MISFSPEPQVDNALFKTNAENAKDSAQIADKCNDPAASWLRPAEELGMKRISHFWVENCAVRYARRGRGARLRWPLCAGSIYALPVLWQQTNCRGNNLCQHRNGDDRNPNKRPENRTDHAARFGRGLSASGADSASDRFDAGLCIVKKMYNK
jgi:hypothetical protein